MNMYSSKNNKGFIVPLIAISLAAVALVFSIFTYRSTSSVANQTLSLARSITDIAPGLATKGYVDEILRSQTHVTLGNYQPSGGIIYHLQNSATSTQTTITLNSFKEPVSNLKYTMALLNTSIGYGTVEPKNPNRSEFISFTGITQNSDGTATLTGLTRGLPRSNTSAGCTASTTLQVAHGGQSEFILSNSPCEQAEYAIKRNDETITGYWTLPEPLSNSNPATKNYVDAHVNGGTVSNAQIVVAGTAGETVSAGQVIYQKQTDGRWYKASVATAEASTTILGIAQGAGTSGNAITTGVLTQGLDSNQSGLTAGVNYFVGTTAGTVGAATSTRSIGKARTTTSLYFSTTFNDVRAMGGVNSFTGTNTFATSSITIGAFPAYQIGKNMQVFSTIGTTTFSVPSGITTVLVEVLGAGGGGGGSNSATAAGGGGGAGAYSKGLVDLTGTSTVQLFIGRGGPGGASNTAGTVGQWSTFGTNGYFITANPGAGGASQATGVGGAGGATTTASYLTIPGSRGQQGWTATGNVNAQPLGGASFFGTWGNSNPPSGFGCGGIGVLNGTAGDGCPGLVIVTW